MRQLTFEDLVDQPHEPPIPLDERVQQELVRIMAEAVAAVVEERGDEDDDRTPVQQQDHS